MKWYSKLWTHKTMQNEKKKIKTIMEMQHRKNKKLNHREKQLMLSVKWKKNDF